MNNDNVAEVAKEVNEKVLQELITNEEKLDELRKEHPEAEA